MLDLKPDVSLLESELIASYKLHNYNTYDIAENLFSGSALAPPPYVGTYVRSDNPSANLGGVGSYIDIEFYDNVRLWELALTDLADYGNPMNVYFNDNGVKGELVATTKTPTTTWQNIVELKKGRYRIELTSGRLVGEWYLEFKISNKTLILHENQYKKWNEKVDNPYIDVSNHVTLSYDASSGSLPSAFGWTALWYTGSNQTIANSSISNGILTIKDTSTTNNSGWQSPNVIDNTLINVIDFECKFETTGTFISIHAVNFYGNVSMTADGKLTMSNPPISYEGFSSNDFVKVRVVVYKEEKFILYGNGVYLGEMKPTLASNNGKHISVMAGNVAPTNQTIHLKHLKVSKLSEEEYLNYIDEYNINGNIWTIEDNIQSDGMDLLTPLLDRRVETLEPLKMSSKSDILPVGSDGKVFSRIVDFSKYLDIRSMKVEVK